jgi:DNA-binding CsgD family transcriptional regulator
MVDERIRRRMTLIVPHFRRALMIGKAIDLARIESAMFADAIDGLAAAVFMVDAEGRLLHANASGEAMLADGDPFRVADRILTAISQRTNRDLAESFAAAALGDAAVEARGIAVPLSGANGQRFAAHVLPMTSGRRREAAHEATAALFVRKVEIEFPAYVRTMGEIYRLTASELRVLHVILDTGGVAPTALLLRLTENTVKTHLRHIFNKTGARSQVDLVKLVAGLSSPLAQG